MRKRTGSIDTHLSQKHYSSFVTLAILYFVKSVPLSVPSSLCPSRTSLAPMLPTQLDTATTASDSPSRESPGQVLHISPAWEALPCSLSDVDLQDEELTPFSLDDCPASPRTHVSDITPPSTQVSEITPRTSGSSSAAPMRSGDSALCRGEVDSTFSGDIGLVADDDMRSCVPSPPSLAVVPEHSQAGVSLLWDSNTHAWRTAASILQQSVDAGYMDLHIASLLGWPQCSISTPESTAAQRIEFIWDPRINTWRTETSITSEFVSQWWRTLALGAP